MCLLVQRQCELDFLIRRIVSNNFILYVLSSLHPFDVLSLLQCQHYISNASYFDERFPLP